MAVFVCPRCGERQEQPDAVKEVWHKCQGDVREFEREER